MLSTIDKTFYKEKGLAATFSEKSTTSSILINIYCSHICSISTWAAAALSFVLNFAKQQQPSPTPPPLFLQWIWARPGQPPLDLCTAPPPPATSQHQTLSNSVHYVTRTIWTLCQNKKFKCRQQQLLLALQQHIWLCLCGFVLCIKTSAIALNTRYLLSAI